jgi:hypothetical protein
MKKYIVTREITFVQEVEATSPEEAGAIAIKLDNWRSVKDYCTDISLMVTDEPGAIFELFEKDDK